MPAEASSRGLELVGPTIDHEPDWTAGFEFRWAGQHAGAVSVVETTPGTGLLACHVEPALRGRGLGSAALRQAIDWVFAEAGLGRVEAHIALRDRLAIRAALRSGLRREGLLRGVQLDDGTTGEVVVLGRLRDDPPPATRDGFTSMLDSWLPVKRVIAQGVLRDSSGRILLCELTYKPEWDLPGGVVDPGESPAQCVVREIREELQLEVAVHGMLAVGWLPPWLGWRDAVLVVFDLGVVEHSFTAAAVLEKHEIVTLHWVDEQGWRDHAADYTARLLDHLPASGDPARYLEDGRPT